MFKYSELKQLQLEITNRCQASCPMCPRNIHGGIDNPNLPLNSWTLDDFKQIVNADVLAQITAITFCGSFGDPAVNNDLPAMCEYLKQSNPSVAVNIHTNGSMRSAQWWADLVNALPDNHNIAFALDGLSDTHSLYRIGTDWNKIIENASSFISAGGNAEWVFIRFKHNEHQVHAAEELSKMLGFKTFSLKDTRRFETEQFRVIDSNGQVTHYLEQPTSSIIKIVDKRNLETFNTWPNKNSINCIALDTKDVYIDAHYNVLPCCILAAFVYTTYDKDLLQRLGVYHENSVVDFGKKIQDEVTQMINKLGGINAKQKPLEDIIDNPVWQTLWNAQWSTGDSTGCIALCSKDSPYITLEDQYVNRNTTDVQV